MPLEKPVLPLPRPRELLDDFGRAQAADAAVAFFFAVTGPVAIILAVGTRGALSEADIASWMFGAFFVTGLFGVACSLLYRQPLIFLWSLASGVLVAPALAQLTFAEVIGAYYVTGVILLVLGLSGWVRRAMEAVPMPIVMAMVAGVLLRFGIDLVHAVRDDAWLAAPMVAAFAAVSALPGVARIVPPLIAALVVGAGAMAWLGSFRMPEAALFELANPNVYVPRFTWNAMVELVLPLLITVLVAQNAQGIAILASRGHRPPTNAITTVCGVASLASAVFGSVSTCLTGPVTGLVSASPEPRRHYTIAIAFNVLVIAFGLLAPFFTRILLAAPPAFVATLGGLAMLRVLQNAFVASFSGERTFGALVCFLVTVADVAILRIGAPFWGLVLGLAVSRLVEGVSENTPRHPPPASGR